MDGEAEATWDHREKAALIALLRNHPDGLGWPELAFEVADAGSAVAVWDQRYEPDLFAVGEPSPLDRAQAELRSWSDADFQFRTFMDPDYPRQLMDVYQFPPILFARGDLLSQDTGVSVVGSRSASDRGLAQAREIASRLVDADITVVSGLAAGIDTVAHETALAADGRTVAVIGTGIRRCYPAQNQALQDEIAARGLVISQFWPDAPPTRSSFPIRNATMSAYGKATIIVEAGERSGARIQARVAVKHGRPVVLMDAVARGTNWGALLRGQPGVTIAESPQQALDHIQEIMECEKAVTELLATSGYA